ncbi:MAG: LysM peptidoglycan-binding domain-containing protein [Planctomycetota bacterium]|jgi:nucleoid-associated protein YgaU
MVDRFKYFLLGLLFLVVAGVIAYDRWNSVDEVAVGEESRVDVTSGGALPLITELAEPEIELPAVPPVERTIPFEELRPEPVPAATPPRPQPPIKRRPDPIPQARVVHVVQSGENLEAIALRYYNTRRGIAWIQEANSLRDRNRIFVNQKLVIPARKESVVRRSTSRAAASKKIPSTYEVKSGDGNLYAICRRFYGASGEGARVARIMELNGLYSADVTPGTKLTLPPR